MCETSARSSAKCRSSRVQKTVHLIPRGRSPRHGCLKHHPINCQVEEQCQHRTSLSNTGLHTEAGLAVSHSALEVVVEALDDKDDLLWNSICPEYAPWTFSVDAVESLLKIHVVDVQLPLPFSALFYDVALSEGG